MKNLDQRGFSLWLSLATLVILGTLGTYLGKMAYYSIKTRNRMEAKVSIIDNESTLAELIAAKMKRIQNDAGNANFCGITGAQLKTLFNDSPPVFPAPSALLRIEDDKSADPTLKAFDALLPSPSPGVQQDIKTALASCSTINTPAPVGGTNPPGVYTFCVSLDNSNVEPQRSKSFIYSERAFAQVRVELTYQSLAQDKKVLETAPPCSTWIAAPEPQRQFKLTYRIFWKERGDSLGFYSFLGSKMVNLPELRDF